MLVILSTAYFFSEAKQAVKWKTIGAALLVQVSIGAFALYVPIGQTVLAGMSAGVQQVLSYANDGINFLFGDLGGFKLGFIFAIHVLMVIVFFSALIAVLYHLGIMQLIIRVIGGGLQKFLGTSRAESFSATANIFVGQTEAPLVVRPFIAKMTRSELFAIMAGGLSTIAGGVLAGFASMGISVEYLITASFMAAPGGLLMAKMLVPETEPEKISNEEADADIDESDKPANVFDAAAQGAANGAGLAANVGAMLVAFISLIALLNGILGGLGGLVGFDGLTLQTILGYLFSPVALVMGVPLSEATTFGSLLGQKLVMNEFVAYVDFTNVRETLSAHSQAIITFALCGFANLSSIAILLGGIGGMAPNRRKEIAQMGMRAVLAGTFANLMSASIAGIFIAIA
ncbi:NupC/NupG family nucleoside CNT transporter [Endozoicomonas gorgoniicola]|uniref:Nucleoside permease n=2 Tax=Endozoicomonas gorgoniicola TaxID=1234144 RepID=A0ABT3MUR7_9GAMM|nr:NupC/NupG family nucleoside CNT transporter [Endozoicomonas gorgoniicola]MCW7553131.1 NupC/NupG family nucleoside CNT transporter [Endozoicomonas gorgoniicola]